MTEYNAEFHPRLAAWISRWGLNDNEISAELGISTAILEGWRSDHKDFAEAIETGRGYWAKLAEQSMQKLIKGYDADESVIDIGNDGQPAHIKKITRHVPPNAQAVIFQIKNARTFQIAARIATDRCPSMDCPFSPSHPYFS